MPHAETGSGVHSSRRFEGRQRQGSLVEFWQQNGTQYENHFSNNNGYGRRVKGSSLTKLILSGYIRYQKQFKPAYHLEIPVVNLGDSDARVWVIIHY